MQWRQAIFWRGVIGYLPAQLVQTILGFASIVLFTRLLSPEAYGQYALALSVTGLVQCVGLTWLEAAMERFHIAESDRGEAALHYATLQRAFAVMAGIIALGTALALLVLPLTAEWKIVIAVGMAAMIVRSALKIVQHRRAAEGQVGTFVAVDIVSGVGGFLIGAGLTFLHMGAAAPLAGLGLAAGVCLLMATAGEWRRARGGAFEAPRAIRYAQYGLPLSLSLVLTLVLASTDRFVIAGYLDEASVGMYFAAFGLAYRPLDILFTWLGTAALPAVIAAYERQGEAGVQSAARTQIGLMLGLAIPAVAGLTAVSAPLAELMVPQPLRAGVALLMPWMALSALFAGLNGHYLEQAFTLSRRSGMLMASMAAPAVANVGLNLLLVPRFGLVGAAWATTGSLALGTVVSVLLGRRYIRLPTPLGLLARFVLGAAAMSAALWAVPDWGGAVELAVKVAVGIAVYGGIVLASDLIVPTGLRATAVGAVTRKLRPAAAAA